MVRKRRKSAGPRVGSFNANRAERLRVRPIQPRSVLQDRRRYVFDSLRVPRRTLGESPRFAVGGSVPDARRRGRVRPGSVQFKAPRTVLVCVRRKERREVIHAKGIAGSRVKKGRRNFWSKVRC